MIDKNLPIPLYYQLKEHILNEINSGAIKSGEAIPTEKELSANFEISRTTVRQAIMDLVKSGYLYRVKSKGTFVAYPKMDLQFIIKSPTFNDQMRELGKRARTDVLVAKLMPASSVIAEYLQIAKGNQVLFIKRLRFADDEPILVVDAYLTSNCCFALEHDLQEESLYKVLSSNPETKVSSMVRTIEATISEPEESKLMNIQIGFPIQSLTSVAYNAVGKPIEYAVSHYRGDRNKFTVELKL